MTIERVHVTRRAARTLCACQCAAWLVVLVACADGSVHVLLSGRSLSELRGASAGALMAAILPQLLLALWALPLAMVSHLPATRRLLVRRLGRSPVLLEHACAAALAAPIVAASLAAVLLPPSPLLYPTGGADGLPRALAYAASGAALAAGCCLHETLSALVVATLFCLLGVGEAWVVWYLRGGHASATASTSWSVPLMHTASLGVCAVVAGRCAQLRELWLRHEARLTHEARMGAQLAARLLVDALAPHADLWPSAIEPSAAPVVCDAATCPSGARLARTLAHAKKLADTWPFDQNLEAGQAAAIASATIA